MATAKVETIEVKPAQPAVTKDVVTLTLSRDEAETLRTLAGFVGGSPRVSRRKHTDAIVHALVGAGITCKENHVNARFRAVYFDEEDGI